jgi:nitrite reductase (NADH) large subunit
MDFVIIGGGVAGITAASTLRSLDKTIEISIYSEERISYYPRSGLIDFLRGKLDNTNLSFYSDKWYADHKISLFSKKSVIALHPDKKQIVVLGGKSVLYDRLLLATGAMPVIPEIPGRELDGIFTLRTIEDVSRIREFASNCQNAVIIGGGLLGLETAAAIKELVQSVTVVERSERLIPRQIDAAAASILFDILKEKGIDIILSTEPRKFTGEGKVESIILDDGATLQTQMVVICTGIQPSIGLASGAGLKLNQGIIVNEYLKTSASDIYAAGDVAEFHGLVYGTAQSAMEQARIAARNMLLSKSAHYSGSIFQNNLKIPGVHLLAAGLSVSPGGEVREKAKQDKKKQTYEKIVVRRGKIVGAVTLGLQERESYIIDLVSRHAPVKEYNSGGHNDDF